jgi:hypothetical protein
MMFVTEKEEEGTSALHASLKTLGFESAPLIPTRGDESFLPDPIAAFESLTTT